MKARRFVVALLAAVFLALGLSRGIGAISAPAAQDAIGPALPAFTPACDPAPVESVPAQSWKDFPPDKLPVEFMIDSCLEPFTEMQDAVIGYLESQGKTDVDGLVDGVSNAAILPGRLNTLVGFLEKISKGWEAVGAKCVATGFVKSLGGAWSVHSNVSDLQETLDKARKRLNKVPQGPGEDRGITVADVAKLIKDTSESMTTINKWANKVLKVSRTDFLPDLIGLTVQIDAARKQVQELQGSCGLRNADRALVDAQRAGKETVLAARVQYAKRQGEKNRWNIGPGRNETHQTSDPAGLNSETWMKLVREEERAAQIVKQFEAVLVKSVDACAILHQKAPSFNQFAYDFEQRRRAVDGAIRSCRLDRAEELLAAVRAMERMPCGPDVSGAVPYGDDSPLALPTSSTQSAPGVTMPGAVSRDLEATIRKARAEGCSVKVLRFGVSPKMSLAKPADTVALKAYAVYSDEPNTTVDVTSKVKWSGERTPPFGVAGGDVGKTFQITATLEPETTMSKTVQGKISDVASVSVLTRDEQKVEVHGPFTVTLSDWTSTGVGVKPGDAVGVKAGGIFRNPKGEVMGGAGGWGYWGWFVLIAKVGDTNAASVGANGTLAVTAQGTVQLGMPRAMGGKFVPEDASNSSGSVSAYVFVRRKVGA
jgi:hypothetical protein